MRFTTKWFTITVWLSLDDLSSENSGGNLSIPKAKALLLQQGRFAILTYVYLNYIHPSVSFS